MLLLPTVYESEVLFLSQAQNHCLCNSENAIFFNYCFICKSIILSRLKVMIAQNFPNLFELVERLVELRRVISQHGEILFLFNSFAYKI